MHAVTSGSGFSAMNHKKRVRIMTCIKYLELMYLRDDELEEQERIQLEHHKSECASCAAEYARVESARKTIRAMNSRPPVVSDPLLLINEVIGRIERGEKKASPSAPQSALDRLTLWLSVPIVRGAMAGLLLLISGSFVVEYTSGFVTMKGAEEEIERSSSFHDQYSAAGMMDQGNLVNTAAELLKLISGKRSYVELSNDWVVMDKQSFGQLLLLYKNLKDNPSQLSPDFRAANPGLAKLLETTRDTTQLNQLLKDRESLIRELNQLLPKERITP